MSPPDARPPAPRPGDPQAGDRPAPIQRPASSRVLPWVVAALTAALLVAAWWWTGPRRTATPPPVAVGDVAPVAPQPAPAPLASAPVEPADAAASDLPVAPLAADAASVAEALSGLLGQQAVLRFVQTDDFARRVAATVDNLARAHAAPRLWPVHPTRGRFTVDDGNRIAPENAARYEAMVQLVTSLPPAQAAALYRRLQPQLQDAYEALGFPGRSFHARLLEVIEHLLDTPAAPPAPSVTLTDVKGPIPSERPWVRYEYADPALESMSAGRKILLRVGPAHQQALKAWLRRFLTQTAR